MLGSVLLLYTQRVFAFVSLFLSRSVLAFVYMGMANVGTVLSFHFR